MSTYSKTDWNKTYTLWIALMHCKKQRQAYFPNGWCTNFWTKSNKNKLKQNQVPQKGKFIWLRVPPKNPLEAYGFWTISRSEVAESKSQETHLAIANFHLISEWILLFLGGTVFSKNLTRNLSFSLLVFTPSQMEPKPSNPSIDNEGITELLVSGRVSHHQNRWLVHVRLEKPTIMTSVAIQTADCPNPLGFAKKSRNFELPMLSNRTKPMSKAFVMNFCPR